MPTRPRPVVNAIPSARAIFLANEVDDELLCPSVTLDAVARLIPDSVTLEEPQMSAAVLDAIPANAEVA